MKRYRVKFYPTNAEVEVEDNEDENEAEVLAYELLYNGELYSEVESVELIEENIPELELE